MQSGDTITRLARWYVLAAPRLHNALQRAQRGECPAVLLAELYGAARARPSPLCRVLELDPDRAPLVPVLAIPVPVSTGALLEPSDPDQFTVRWYVIHEATLEGTLEAAAAGEPAAALASELYAWAKCARDARVVVVEVPVDTPAMGLDLGPLEARPAR